MSITVATVALNAADDLPLTLESVIAQDHDDLELLVVDGSSWDESHEILELYRDDIDRLEIIEDAGIFDAMNRAAAFASKEYILFLNAGDRFYTERALSKLWERRRASADIIYGNHIYRDRGVDRFEASTDFREQMKILRKGNISGKWLSRFPAHQATMTRVSLLLKKRYDTALRICADHDFLLRAVHDGAEPQYIDEIVSHYMGGGFSAQQGDLCRLEWNNVYRRYSERPDLVDRFFYRSNSPFEGQRSLMSGEIIMGLQPSKSGTELPELDEPFKWVTGSGLRVVSPEHRGATALHVSGFNHIASQTIEVVADGKTLARERVPTGAFSIEIRFDRHIEPSTAIDLIPTDSIRHPESAIIVAFALTELRFEFEAEITPRPVGDPIFFNASTAHETESYLLAGWWSPEGTHIWSKGDVSELRLSSLDTVTRLNVRARTNPAVPGQTLQITVNGTVVAESGPTAGNEYLISAPVGEVWRGGAYANRITLRPSRASNVGADHRVLGVSLVSVELG
ncbi:glycosyltransferase [Acuticoccus sp. M5D2P5]|uniref:glycosyltransferase n=1 Tax=Acuticoccus kalidii TaxID=2910977 RepID=UPI001F2F9F1C|nr:glycosyltransferase [Acuticoccus kalidii]MCF3936457.1 glycosyltransferase [Acuticoccus kalidii]